MRVEPGAETFATAVVAELPWAVKAVEERQYTTFPDPPTVFVCSTPESFQKMTGRKSRALTYRKAVFLSPRLLDEGPAAIRAYLTHELSHLVLVQRLPSNRLVKIPSWFSEGLATLVSDGGGAGRVTEAEAVTAIRSGRSFNPHLDAGYWDLLFPKHASHWGLEPHLFYRESMLFVAFLKGRDEAAYGGFLTALQHDGTEFLPAFSAAFGPDTRRLWAQFTEDLGTKRH